MRTRIGWTLIGVVIMALLLVTALTMIRTTQVTKSTNDIAALIRADQKAGIARSRETQDGLQRTADAVATINDVVVAATICAKRPDVNTTAQARACIKHELALATN